MFSPLLSSVVSFLRRETWQLRLYCTSSSFYGTGAAAYRFNNAPCPIEFPPTCEIRVNNTQLSASTKGLKKKPGTAPPPNLGKTVNLNAGASNRVELIYVNSQQNNNQTPTPPKVLLSSSINACCLINDVISIEILHDCSARAVYRHGSVG